MERNYQKFPETENGNILWQLTQKLGVLPDEILVDFAIIFPTYENALKFGMFLLKFGYRVQVNNLEDFPDVDKNGYMGEVIVGIFMEINEPSLTQAENWLAENSKSLNGKNDGWGFLGD